MPNKSTGKTAPAEKIPTQPAGIFASFTGFFLKPAVQILGTLIVGVLIYSNTFNSPFVFDDTVNIEKNDALRNFSALFDENLAARIDPVLGSGFSSRIVGYSTFTINYMLHGTDVRGYHIFNLLIHLLNVLLVYALVRLTFCTPSMKNSVANDGAFSPQSISSIAVFCAILFAVHPLQTQAVTYIVQRFTSLVTLFYLLSLLLYIKARLSETSFKQYAFFITALFSAVIAMKTKEISFTLPVVIALYEFMFLDGSLKNRLLCLLPFLLTMAIIPLTLLSTAPSGNILDSIGTVSREAASISRSDYLFTQFSVITTYIRLLFLPINQNLDYDYPIYNSFSMPEVWLPFLFLLLIFALALYLFYCSQKKNSLSWYFRLISFGILYFFIALSVESSIIPIKDVIFEHRVYLPSFGFFLCIVTAFMLLKDRLKGPLHKAVIPALLLIVFILAATAYSRNAVWASQLSLWQDSVNKSPLKARPHTNLGNAHYKMGRVDAALAEYLTSVRLDPKYDPAHYNLGIVYLSLGRLDDAANEFRAAIESDPDSDDAFLSLGIALFRMGAYDEALNEFLNAVEINPYNFDAHFNIAVSYEGKGEFDTALREYLIAAGLNPEDAEPHFGAGLCYLGMKRFDDARIEFRTALSIDPGHVQARRYAGYLTGN
jgi:protein O-mannosyl-transferase